MKRKPTFDHLVATQSNARAHRERKRKRERQQTAAKARAERSTTPSTDRRRTLSGKAATDVAAVPALTPALAKEFALLLQSGVSPTDALGYLAPQTYERVNEKQLTDWLARWTNDPLTLKAVTALNGAEWHHLDSEQRFTIALDKHLCELAHFLYTHRYTNADADTAKKMDKAADRLMAHLDADRTDGEKGDSAWKTFVKEITAVVEASKDATTVPTPLSIPALPLSDSVKFNA